MRPLKFILAITILIVLANTSCSQQHDQPCGNILFKNVDTILNDLKKNGKQSIYVDSLKYEDYEAILCLDLQSSFTTLKHIHPGIEQEIGFDSSHLVQYLKEARQENHSVELMSIKDLFCDTEILKSVIRKHPHNGSVFIGLSTVYIKENTACFSIYGQGWDNTFLAAYDDKKLMLKFLWGTQE